MMEAQLHAGVHRSRKHLALSTFSKFTVMLTSVHILLLASLLTYGVSGSLGIVGDSCCSQSLWLEAQA